MHRISLPSGILQGFNSDLSLKILNDDVYHALATRSYVQYYQSFRWIYGPEHSNPVVSLQNKFQKMNLPSVYPIVSIYGGSRHAEAFCLLNVKKSGNIV
jgi:hypothetical protein